MSLRSPRSFVTWSHFKTRMKKIIYFVLKNHVKWISINNYYVLPKSIFSIELLLYNNVISDKSVKYTDIFWMFETEQCDMGKMCEIIKRRPFFEFVCFWQPPPWLYEEVIWVINSYCDAHVLQLYKWTFLAIQSLLYCILLIKSSQQFR